ncbi:MAG: hypothetical protein EP344_17850 [Bacteroidetes bacterium]|nr:MAG: hypothetical protein EP344_17850 [Bacteroidota bacterium]
MATALLGVLFLASWGLRTTHLLLLDHVHHVIPACDANHQKHATHLHDARYNPEDCAVCAFLFASPEVVSIAPAFACVKPLVQKTVALPYLLHLSGSEGTIVLRGPPVCPRNL